MTQIQMGLMYSILIQISTAHDRRQIVMNERRDAMYEVIEDSVGWWYWLPNWIELADLYYLERTHTEFRGHGN